MSATYECPACSSGTPMDEWRDRIRGHSVKREECAWCAGTGCVGFEEMVRHGQAMDLITLGHVPPIRLLP